MLVDGRYTLVDGDPAVTLDMWIGDGMLGALRHGEWLAFERAGYTFAPVFDTRTRKVVDPADVILAQLDARKGGGVRPRELVAFMS